MSKGFCVVLSLVIFQVAPVWGMDGFFGRSFGDFDRQFAADFAATSARIAFDHCKLGLLSRLDLGSPLWSQAFDAQSYGDLNAVARQAGLPQVEAPQIMGARGVAVVAQPPQPAPVPAAQPYQALPPQRALPPLAPLNANALHAGLEQQRQARAQQIRNEQAAAAHDVKPEPVRRDAKEAKVARLAAAASSAAVKAEGARRAVPTPARSSAAASGYARSVASSPVSAAAAAAPRSGWQPMDAVARRRAMYAAIASCATMTKGQKKRCENWANSLNNTAVMGLPADWLLERQREMLKDTLHVLGKRVKGIEPSSILDLMRQLDTAADQDDMAEAAAVLAAVFKLDSLADLQEDFHAPMVGAGIAEVEVLAPGNRDLLNFVDLTGEDDE